MCECKNTNNESEYIWSAQSKEKGIYMQVLCGLRDAKCIKQFFGHTLI